MSKQKTSREGHKSAPYPRLKSSKRTSKCRVFFYRTRKTQKFDLVGAPGPASADPLRVKRGDPFGFFNIRSVAKHEKKLKAI